METTIEQDRVSGHLVQGWWVVITWFTCWDHHLYPFPSNFRRVSIFHPFHLPINKFLTFFDTAEVEEETLDFQILARHDN